MKSVISTLLFLVWGAAQATVVHLAAAEYVGHQAMLFTYGDYFSMQTELAAMELVNDSGKVVLTIENDAIELVKLRIDHVVADFFLEPNKTYYITFGRPAPGVARTINGSTKVNPYFEQLDHLDINALLTDMNGHIEAFQADEYSRARANDQQAAQAEHIKARPVDTVIVRQSPFLARVDTFERKINGFYSDVDHPYFKTQLEYALAQVRITPQHSRKRLYERYVENRPILYRSPEYVKFFKAFFKHQLMQQVYAQKPAQLKAAVATHDLPTVMALLQENDFLKNEELSALVAIHELYLDHSFKAYNTADVVATIKEAEGMNAGITAIAKNMQVDLTAMHAASTWPSDLIMVDGSGKRVGSDTVFTGHTYVTVTASWCTYCEKEVKTLSTYVEQYGDVLDIVLLSIDGPEAYTELALPANVTVYFLNTDPLAFEKLRLYTIPSFYLLNDNVLHASPAAAPSQGVEREFHRIRNDVEIEKVIKVWDK